MPESKATNYEIATRVPMMIWTPKMPKSGRGKTTDALVELIDIYPTLCELAGLPAPDFVQGVSLRPILDRVHPMEQGRDAFEQMAAGRLFGKIGIEIPQ